MRSWVHESDIERRGTRAHRPAEWYGWQILLADGGLAATLVTAGELRFAGGVIDDATVLGYLADGPLIHSLHGQSGKGAISMGLRLILPIGGLVAGLFVANAGAQNGAGGYSVIGDTLRPLADAAIGFGVGMGVASVTDALALAWAPGHIASGASATPAPFGVAPAIAIATGEHREAIPIFGVRGRL